MLQWLKKITFKKPDTRSAFEQAILGRIIGPNFANGIDDVDTMIATIQDAMDFKLKENPLYLTQESQLWIRNTLPTMKAAVKREIDFCWKALEE